MQAELEQTYPRLGTIYSLCSVYYPNIRQRSDVLNRRNFLKTGFYEGIKVGCDIVNDLDDGGEGETQAQTPVVFPEPEPLPAK